MTLNNLLLTFCDWQNDSVPCILYNGEELIADFGQSRETFPVDEDADPEEFWEHWGEEEVETFTWNGQWLEIHMLEE